MCQQPISTSYGNNGNDAFKEWDIVYLNNNVITKNLIPFEVLFDRDDHKRGIFLEEESYKECEFTLGKMLKVGVQNSNSEVEKIISHILL